MTAQLRLIPDPKTLERIQGLDAKAAAHRVQPGLLPGDYVVISAGSGRRYRVTVNEDGHSARCNCRYGNPYGGKHGRRRSACSHALAAIHAHQQAQGRRIQVRPDEHFARRSKHRRAEFGQGLWITSRAA